MTEQQRPLFAPCRQKAPVPPTFSELSDRLKQYYTARPLFQRFRGRQ